MTSWHALLQQNVLDRRCWHTRDELHEAVVFWIEHTYNRRRRQRALRKLTPVEYELAFTTQAAPAACQLNPRQPELQPELQQFLLAPRVEWRRALCDWAAARGEGVNAFPVHAANGGPTRAVRQEPDPGSAAIPG